MLQNRTALLLLLFSSLIADLFLRSVFWFFCYSRNLVVEKGIKMKNKRMINYKLVILFIIAILLILSMPKLAFAEDEDQIKEEDLRRVSTLEGFWLEYSPEDIGYHVIDNMEKICILGDEEPLEIQITKEENDGSLLDHFTEVKVTNVNNDIWEIFYEPEKTPDYEVSEKDGVLSFIFDKDELECPYDANRYEFLFMFDDGQAYSLVWATKGSDMLEYTEEGHVWFTPAPDFKSLEEMGVYLPTLDNELAPPITQEAESIQLIADETADEVSETRNIIFPIILVCAIITAIAVVAAYRMKTKKR